MLALLPAVALWITAAPPDAGTMSAAPAIEGEVVVKDFHFRSGESLPELRLHYTTLGTPRRDARGRVTNAVMIAHGTARSGRDFVENPRFTGALFGPGQPLDTSRYYVILPDAIGHGRSSKPSDGLRTGFPHYDYDDMVEAQVLLVRKLGVDHLRLYLGTSMGCMHAFTLAEAYPELLDAAMPLACSVVEIAGRNRIFRKVLVDAIRNDPGYLDGKYTEQPRGNRTALGLLFLEVTGAVQMQQAAPTREQADAELARYIDGRVKSMDANDVVYAWESSRSYNPLPKLEQIKAAVTWVNFADDAINPPELGIAEREIKRIKRGRLVLVPMGPATRGHASYFFPELWKGELERLLKDTEH